MQFKVAHLPEKFIPAGNVCRCERLEPFETECFHVKARDDAAVDYSFAERVSIHLAGFGEVAGKGAGKTISGTGRIMNVSVSNSRASLSFKIRQSIFFHNSSNASFAMLIQRSIVSATTNFGFDT